MKLLDRLRRKPPPPDERTVRVFVTTRTWTIVDGWYLADYGPSGIQ